MDKTFYLADLLGVVWKGVSRSEYDSHAAQEQKRAALKFSQAEQSCGLVASRLRRITPVRF
jgi:hypothetical protein